MLDCNLLPQRIKDLRKYFKYTQEELSEKLNITTKFLSELETGKKNPSTTTIIKILNTLNISFDNFINNNYDIQIVKQQETLNKIYKLHLDECNEMFLLNILIAINKRNVN